jgi:hypothetical protein
MMRGSLSYLACPALAGMLFAQEASQEQTAASPVPAAESQLTGSIDAGYRWQAGFAGSADTYRSIINLGQGPKLLGLDFTWTGPKHRLFDHVHVRAASWGGDPYGTLHVDVFKARLYDFRGDYRDIAYFNFLPSFADPLLSRGITLNEQSFDIRRHLGTYSLDLLPGRAVVPYLAFDRNASSGTGATVFVSDANEYPVPTRLRDSTNLYRGGVRFELRRMHVTLEEGGTMFKDDQSLFSGPNVGNVRTPVLGARLSLNGLLAAYGIRGTSTYSQGLFTANPLSWLDLYGQFLFSQPETDVNYQHAASGTFYLQPELLFYTGQQYLVSSAAKLPHTSASAGAEIRPLRRIRIIQSWLTDRLHNAGSAGARLSLAPASIPGQAALLGSSLATDYNQEEVNVLADLTRKITLRGGYRYVWGEASSAVLPAAGLSSTTRGRLRRHAGLGAITYRPGGKLSITAEAEAASSSGVYFRTSLYDYQKVRAQARHQVTGSLNLAADFIALSNQNPSPGVRYGYLALQESLSLLWTPRGGKLWDVQGSYTRSTVRSSIDYLVPQDLSQQVSRYRENSHTASALFSIHPRSGTGHMPTLTAGGSLYRSAGFLSAMSRPANYYQPLVILRIPVIQGVQWFSEWRYYGYGEAFYLYEGFRTNLVTTGLRLTR